MVAYDLFDEGLSLGIFKGFKGRKKDLSRCFACFQCATSIYGIISNCLKDNNFLLFPCSGVGTVSGFSGFPLPPEADGNDKQKNQESIGRTVFPLSLSLSHPPISKAGERGKTTIL